MNILNAIKRNKRRRKMGKNKVNQKISGDNYGDLAGRDIKNVHNKK